jgi:hypothetical protein
MNQRQPDPLATMAAIFATLDLVAAATQAIRDTHAAGLPPAARLAAIVANAGFVAAWEQTPDGARRDLLTTAARLAVEAGVPADDLEPNSNAAMLADLARHERASDPAAPITADSPLAQPAGPTGIYAISLVCDATEPEAAKRAASGQLALAAAARTRPTWDGKAATMPDRPQSIDIGLHQPGELRCDFCAGPTRPTCYYPAAVFQIVGPAGLAWESGDHWYACPRCAAFIDRDDDPGLRRALNVSPQLVTLAWRPFHANRQGPPVPIGPGEDPRAAPHRSASPKPSPAGRP